MTFLCFSFLLNFLSIFGARRVTNDIQKNFFFSFFYVSILSSFRGKLMHSNIFLVCFVHVLVLFICIFLLFFVAWFFMEINSNCALILIMFMSGCNEWNQRTKVIHMCRTLNRSTAQSPNCKKRNKFFCHRFPVRVCCLLFRNDVSIISFARSIPFSMRQCGMSLRVFVTLTHTHPFEGETKTHFGLVPSNGNRRPNRMKWHYIQRHNISISSCRVIDNFAHPIRLLALLRRRRFRSEQRANVCIKARKSRPTFLVGNSRPWITKASNSLFVLRKISNSFTLRSSVIQRFFTVTPNRIKIKVISDVFDYFFFLCFFACCFSSQGIYFRVIKF